MFGRREPLPAPVAPPPQPPKRPVAQILVVGTEPLGGYEQLASELDFMPAQLLEEQLRRFLAESKIEVFDNTEVDLYLAAIAEKDGKVWIWRPLRPQDRTKWEWSGRAGKVEGAGSSSAWGHGSYRGKRAECYRPYNFAVPVHILRNVKKIQDKFGKQVKFFVSDYAVPKPDPFIMVTARDMDPIIFGVWDEPGFGAAE